MTRPSLSAAARQRAGSLLLALGILAMAAGIIWLAGAVAERRALADAQIALRTDAQLRAALLASEVERFRLLPLALAGDSDLAAALAGGGAADGPARQMLDRKLERLARETGAAVIYVLDRDSTTIAASNRQSRASFVGENYAFRRYVIDARRNGSAMQFALGTVSREPGLYLARQTPADGIIVVKLEFDGIERQWARANGTTLVRNGAGVIVVTSVPTLRFDTVGAVSADRAQQIRHDLRLEADTLRPWRPAGAQLTAAVPTGIAGWTLVLAVPRAEALGGSVTSAQMVAAAVLLMLGALGWTLAARRRRQRQMRAAAATRTAELEAAVAARTAELRHEMAERQASEDRAAVLREGLRQANRLATLGQVTASVAHETAQPVAAIRTYASNGVRLLERGEHEEVRDNLAAIDRLADRIGTVTAQLRGFARKGSRQVEPIPLAEVIDGALLILQDRLRAIALTRPAMPPGLRVMGGRVRLEQVLVNLLQNAADALAGRIDAAITIAVDQPTAETVRLLVRDNGRGIAPELADRLFTPFATSRENGLGLGLVIAQDIAHDLGGTLRLVPAPQGASFELILRSAP